jgi:hypothetical protein
MACVQEPISAGPLFHRCKRHIRHHQFGEGEYEQSEMVIQQLLAEAGTGSRSRELVSVDAGGTEASSPRAPTT